MISIRTDRPCDARHPGYHQVVRELPAHPSKHETLCQCWFNVGHRHRRWTSIKPTLAQRLVLAGIVNHSVVVIK